MTKIENVTFEHVEISENDFHSCETCSQNISSNRHVRLIVYNLKKISEIVFVMGVVKEEVKGWIAIKYLIVTQVSEKIKPLTFEHACSTQSYNGKNVLRNEVTSTAIILATEYLQKPQPSYYTR